MKYRRMPIEIESPEQMGYGNIDYNLTESSVSDVSLKELGLDPGELILCYGDHLGKPELRELIAAEGKGLSADDALTAPGAAAALFIVASSLLESGDHVIVAHPNYATNVETPRALGCRVDLLPLTFENGFRVDVGHLEAMVTPDTRLISLTCPHNPTGAVIPESDLKRIVALAESKGCYLLYDETYRDMTTESPAPLAAELSAKAVSISSMSKSYGLPGIRMGWLISRDKNLRETFLAAKEQIFITCSVIDEQIAFEYLSRKDAYFPAVREKIAKAREAVSSWMRDQKLLEWVAPGGGVACFPRFKNDADVDVDLFYKILNEKYKTYVGPGHWFEMDRKYFRIGYGWPTPEQLEKGLANITLAADEAVR